MNLKWISEMFVIEDADIEILNNVDKTVSDGGQIFFAISDEDDIMAACMVAPLPSGEWEIEKFCAKDKYAGNDAATACLLACIDYEKQKRVRKLVIVTNTKCERAIYLYLKHGFVEMEVDRNLFPFERANIAFQQILD